jgi:hypothetical protein
MLTLCVRSAGMGGISLLLIERDMPGVSVRPIKTQARPLLPLRERVHTGWLTRVIDAQGGWCSLPAYVTLDEVKVPVKVRT